MSIPVEPIGTAIFVLLVCAYGLLRCIEEEVVPRIKERRERRAALRALIDRERFAKHN